jgi:hypothetical protein
MMPFNTGSVVADVPQLRRGIVWCMTCGRTRRVDAGGALAHGWPKCCGYTMTIDSPEERAAFAAARDGR